MLDDNTQSFTLAVMSAKGTKQTAHELALVLGLLVRKMRARSSQESELSWTQKSTIVRLNIEGTAAISDLARFEEGRSQTMGTAVAALEEAGIVRRSPHTTDGRQLNSSLTHHGAQLRKTGQDARRTWLGQAIAQLPQEDQDALLKATEILRRRAAFS